MIERYLTRLRARHSISDVEERAVRDMIADIREVAGRQIVIREGQRLEFSTLLLDGVMCRFKDLKNGQRQVTELHVPGDFADMHSFTLKRLDHDVQTLTSCAMGVAPHDRIRRVVEEHPRLGRIFWFGTNLDAAIHRAWEVSLGLRSAAQRVGALFCELHVRFGLVGLADQGGFRLPITQVELAECLGLTAVHLNRVLRQLRDDGLTTFQNGRVDLLDLDRLRRLADFNDDYLYLRPEEL